MTIIGRCISMKIYYCNTGLYKKEDKLKDLIAVLPTSLHKRVLRYQSESAAYNFVVGRLLLKEGLSEFGLDNDLEQIQIQDNGKPFVDGIQFNISHSGDQVVCCFSENGVVGIDIEEIRKVDFDDFTTMFTHTEWKVIRSADDPLRQFYWYWTRKESIIKALGLKLSYLHEIELEVGLDYFELDGVRWFLREVDFGEGVLCTVCCKMYSQQPILSYFPFRT